MDEPQADMQTEIFDVRSIDLNKLGEIVNPVLAKSIQRIRNDADRPGAALSGFQNSL
jgi:FXSXX-COOH protein